MRHRLVIGTILLVAVAGLGGCGLLRRIDASAHPPPVVEPSTEPDAVEAALIEEATVARELGDDDIALALFHDVLAENPMIATAYIGMGEIYFDREVYDRAELAFGRAARLEPDNTRAHYGQGFSLQMLDRALEAMKAYHRAITIDPDHPGANLNLGTIYLGLGEADGALTFAERAVELEPDSGRARANLGAVYEILDRPEDAIEQYLAAAELMEPTPELLMNLVNVFARAKRYQEALNAAEALARIDPSADVYERIGWAQFRLRNDRRSLAAYREAIVIDPDHWPSWNGVGVISLNRWLISGRADVEAMTDARAAFRQSLRSNPRQQKVVALMARYGLR
jgi:tetratricopeptide (TPR) repeat protein